MDSTLQQQWLNMYQMVAIRVKHVPELKDEGILKRTKEHFSLLYPYVLMSEETSGGKHIHGLVAYQHKVEDNLEKKKEIIRGQIREIFPTAKSNKCLYVRESKDAKQLTKYTLKEGKFLYSGFMPKYIETLYKCSVKKENLNSKIQNNEEKFFSAKRNRNGELVNEDDFHDFCISYIQIKTDHGQNLYNNHIKAYFQRMQIKGGYISVCDYYRKYFLEY